MQYIRIKSLLSNTMADILTRELHNGLKYSATSPMCARALAMLMAYDYNDNDIAQIARDLFNTKARIGRVNGV